MGIRLTVRCDKCGHHASLMLSVDAVGTTPVDVAPAAKVKLCGCGHEHGPGACGHGKGTSFGGCPCTEWHSRRRGLTQARKEVKGSTSDMGACERAILTVLAQRGEATPRTMLALRAGYSRTSGGFAGALATLRANALTEATSRGEQITDAGKKALGSYDPLPTGSALTDFWIGRVGTCAGAILQNAALVYPGELSREELAKRTGYSLTSGGFAGALAELRTLGLLEGTKATAELMGR